MPVISKNILDYLLWVGIFSAAAIIGLTINKLVIRKNLGEAEKYYDMAMEIKLTIGLISTTVFVAYIFWKFNL